MAADIKEGIKFDATINLGHILTFIGFIVAGFMAWQGLDKRVASLEENKKYQQLRDDSQDAANDARQASIQSVLSDIKLAIQKLDEKLEHRREGS